MSNLSNKDIIKRWKAGESIDWKGLTVKEKKEWLLACLFYTGLPKGTISIKTYVIEGDQVNSSVDLYCFLGQVFFGDKGYFGQGLDGLHDCFSDLIVSPGTTLTIKNHRKLANVLNTKLDTYFTMLTDIFKEGGLTVNLE